MSFNNHIQKIVPIYLLYKKLCACLCLLYFFNGTPATCQTFVYNPFVDVQHYNFQITFTDSADFIEGLALISVTHLTTSNTIQFDMAGINSKGTGMKVLYVKKEGVPLSFSQQNNKLVISNITQIQKGDTGTYEIAYKGLPADGLIFSKNKFGNRTIFSDDYPNRAHNWLPCIDHSSDKATVEFYITAPLHYKVISNGILFEETVLPQGKNKITHWREDVALPVKIMALGLADFAVGYAGNVDCIQLYSYVYTENKLQGFYDFSLATDILPFFIKTVGPYPYKKLANVQSTTMYGGMENANAIFYSENIITGTRKNEPTIAHEIAHQWFGNSVTETDWRHIWLSEGFATAYTNWYMQNKYGNDTLIHMLKQQRISVIDFSKKITLPVVDSLTTNYMKLLNPNSYQKGGWILHMLKNKLGDSLFNTGIQNYYKTYAGKNAGTQEFKNVMEQTSGINLEQFFHQWLFTTGQPALKINQEYSPATNSVAVTIEQMQSPLFIFDLDLQIITKDSTLFKTISMNERKKSFVVDHVKELIKIIPDPFTRLLFESVISN